MNWKTFQGYVLAVISGLILIAGGLLVVLQWGNHAAFSLYGKNYSGPNAPNTALLMLCSAVGGVVGFFLARVLLRGVKIIRRENRRKREVMKAVRATQPKAPAAAPPRPPAPQDRAT